MTDPAENISELSGGILSGTRTHIRNHQTRCGKPRSTRRNSLRIHKAGFKIVAIRSMRLTKDEAGGFYAVHKARPFFGELTNSMSSGKIFAMVLEAEGAVSQVARHHGRHRSEAAARHHPPRSGHQHRRQLHPRLRRPRHRRLRNRLLLRRPRFNLKFPTRARPTPGLFLGSASPPPRLVRKHKRRRRMRPFFGLSRASLLLYLSFLATNPCVDPLHELGRVLLILGAIITVTGALLYFGARLPFRLGRLPGDIVHRGEHTTFYFPIVTCLLLSAALFVFSPVALLPLPPLRCVPLVRQHLASREIHETFASVLRRSAFPCDPPSPGNLLRHFTKIFPRASASQARRRQLHRRHPPRRLRRNLGSPRRTRLEPLPLSLRPRARLTSTDQEQRPRRLRRSISSVSTTTSKAPATTSSRTASLKTPSLIACKGSATWLRFSAATNRRHAAKEKPFTRGITACNSSTTVPAGGSSASCRTQESPDDPAAFRHGRKVLRGVATP